MTALVDPAHALDGLKDFQRSTARYVYERMYDEIDPALRFLVADEVGLGKTLVARGVIAQVLAHLANVGDKRHDIVYVCSNQAIASQNLRKLNPTDTDVEMLPTRFTMLPAQSEQLQRQAVNLIAITPGTSLSFGQSGGMFDERALAFALLTEVWGADRLRGSGPARVFFLGIADDSSAARRLRDRSREFAEDLDDAVIKGFRAQLQQLNARREHEGRSSIWKEFAQLADEFQYRRQEYEWPLRRRRNRFIAELREALATVGIRALEPDLVILDEFQRFKNLLDPADQSWSTRLARELFNYRDRATGRPTRTLLLSATPYRMYTMADDDLGDDHYADFVDTVRFLFDKDVAVDQLQGHLADMRAGLVDAASDGGAAAVAACNTTRELLQKVMVRTERLASTPDRNGMLTTLPLPDFQLEPGDVRAYVQLSEIAEELGERDVLEYWKSSPYLLNFMEGYALKHAFAERSGNGAASRRLVGLLDRSDGLLDWDTICAYRKVDPANAKLRGLLADVINDNTVRLLWLPPSLPYYRTGSAFDAAGSVTKRLVFSAWNVVPKVISTILSYEAERAIVGSDPASAEIDYLTEYGRRPGRLIEFRLDGNRPGGMTSFAFVYPSVALARLGDPRALAHALRARGETPTTELVLREVRTRLHAVLEPMLDRAPATGASDQRWYWAAPLLLDQAQDAEGLHAFLAGASASEAWTGASDDDDDTGSGRFRNHITHATELLEPGGELGRVPDDLLDVLVELAVGGPATAALRALARVTGTDLDDIPLALRCGAARVAWGYRSLFNGPDATALVRNWSDTSLPYWRSALRYAIDGNIQATLDEYAHVLREWLGFVADAPADRIATSLGNAMYDALTLRTASYRTDVLSVDGDAITVAEHRMRGRFAVRFGDQRSEEGTLARTEQVSQAFNSPFWPFVLATTSIGQEGLDFHLYCHAVVHWNLPHNPVDLEQREGRVHRYKGHAVRKNVAMECEAAAFDLDESDPWTAMFVSAASRRAPGETELIPYWVFKPTEAGASINRYVAALPLSRDASRLDGLLRSVAAYRLAFGQPRQEELVEYLLPHFDKDQLADLTDRLRIDLSPPVNAGTG